MKIAIASGKGGTGKTTLAVALALATAERGPVTLLDCDVEEPNCGLFLGIADPVRRPVFVPSPVVDQRRCTGCGICADVCQFNAIAAVKNGAMVFPELCHACGGCALACPAGAITETDRPVGELAEGRQGNLTFVSGLLNIGEAISTRVIQAVKRRAAPEGLTLLDCPPGTACPMVEAVLDADHALLGTEPTPFGLHDLTLAVDTLRTMGVPFGVVLNRAGAGDDRVHHYCRTEGIPLLLEIPDDRNIAEAYSRGEPLVQAVPRLTGDLLRLVDRVCTGEAA